MTTSARMRKMSEEDNSKMAAPQAPPTEDERPAAVVPYFSASRLGATANLPCEIWGSDFRRRLDPETEEPEAAPAGSTEAVDSLRSMHTAALLLTKISR
jgi:hypothetical protein